MNSTDSTVSRITTTTFRKINAMIEMLTNRLAGLSPESSSN